MKIINEASVQNSQFYRTAEELSIALSSKPTNYERINHLQDKLIEVFHKEFDSDVAKLDFGALYHLFDNSGEILCRGIWQDLKHYDPANPSLEPLKMLWRFKYVPGYRYRIRRR